MAEASLKGLYTVRAVKVQHLVELLSEVVEIGKSIPVAVAKKGFRTKGVSVHKGQPIRIISQGDRTWQGEINGQTIAFPAEVVSLLSSGKQWPTSAVIEFFIRPATHKAKKKFYAEVVAPAAREHSWTYLVHSHQCSFYELVHALVTYYKGKNLAEQHVWIDAFCVHQQMFSVSSRKALATKEQNFQTQPVLDMFLVQELHRIISKCDDCLVFVDSWDRPSVLQRTWCMWEIYGASKAKKSINFCLTSKERQRMVKDLSSNYAKATRRLGKCSIRNSQVSIEEDKFALENHLQSSPHVGLNEVNHTLTFHFRSWLADMGLFLLHEMKRKNASTIEIAHLSNQVGLQIWGELSHDKQLHLCHRYRVAQAEELFRDALKRYKGDVGKDHEFVAVACFNLASVLATRAKRDEAVNLCKDAITIRQKLSSDENDENQITLAKCLNLLAELLRDQEEFDKAEKSYQRALVIWKEVYGNDHFLVATGYNNLAELFRIQNREEEAEALYQDALKVLRRQGTRQHFLLMVTIYNNLGLLYETQGEAENAEKAYQLSLRIIRRITADKSCEVADALTNVGSFLYTQEKFEDSETYFKDAVKIQSRIHGRTHQMVGQALENLGIILRMEGKEHEAQKTFKQAVTVFEKSLGLKHPRARKCKHLIENSG